MARKENILFRRLMGSTAAQWTQRAAQILHSAAALKILAECFSSISLSVCWILVGGEDIVRADGWLMDGEHPDGSNRIRATWKPVQ